MTWRRFKHWWVNVFWFHYGKAALITLVAGAVFVYAIYDLANRLEPDFTYTVATEAYVANERLDELTSFLTSVSPDTNGDMQTLIYPIAICMSDPQTGPQERLIVSFLNEENHIYLVDQTNADRLIADEAFADLGELGFASEDLYKAVLVRVEDVALVNALVSEGDALYIGLRAVSDGLSERAEISRAASVEALQALLAAG